MNIAYVTPEFVTSKEKGGLATYTDNISKLLANRGHKIDIITLGESTDEFSYDSNIKVYSCNAETDDLNLKIPGIIYRRQGNELNNQLRKLIYQGHKIDVVQYPNWRAIGLDRIGIPTVVRISSDLPLWRASNQYDFDINVKYSCTKVTDYLEDIALMRADGVFGPSKLIANVIGERCGIEISVIESPFMLECGLDDIPSISGQYILTIGTLKHMKGIRVIGDSIGELLKDNPKVKYVFAGVNSEIEDSDGSRIDAITYLKKRAGEYADRIVYLGVLQKNAICSIAANASVCVLPSRVDNLPNTCIEAMASGGIVIGTKDASFEQLIDNEVNGYLIERDNREQLVSAVNIALRLKEREKEAIKINAKKRINSLNQDSICERMISYYAHVIGQKQRVHHNSEYYNELVKKYNESVYKFDTSLILQEEY